VRDRVGSTLLTLTLKELFEWRLMQTDPNFGNFLFDSDTETLHLIDFGASKHFEPDFVYEYMEMVHACSVRDANKVVDKSIKLGFLTGEESRVMIQAHCEAGFVVGVPFGTMAEYDFGSHRGMTAKVGELGATMLQHRLTAPPEDSYSLHRKLSGAFLACMKLKAKVRCRDIFLKTYNEVKSKRQA
jgi:aarF domain-containing kinase